MLAALPELGVRCAWLGKEREFQTPRAFNLRQRVNGPRMVHDAVISLERVSVSYGSECLYADTLRASLSDRSEYYCWVNASQGGGDQPSLAVTAALACVGSK